MCSYWIANRFQGLLLIVQHLYVFNSYGYWGLFVWPIKLYDALLWPSNLKHRIQIACTVKVTIFRPSLPQFFVIILIYVSDFTWWPHKLDHRQMVPNVIPRMDAVIRTLCLHIREHLKSQNGYVPGRTFHRADAHSLWERLRVLSERTLCAQRNVSTLTFSIVYVGHRPTECESISSNVCIAPACN